MANEITWLRQFLDELGETRNEPLILLMDNTSAIHLTKDPVFHSRTKHIAIKYHLIRDLVEKGMLQTTFIGTKDMAADIFTKALDKGLFEKQRSRLGIVKLSSFERELKK